MILALLFVLAGESFAQQKKDPPKETAPAAQAKPATPQADPQVQMPSQDFQNGLSELKALGDVISKEQAAVEVLQENYNTLMTKLQKAIPVGYQYNGSVFVKIKAPETKPVEPKK